MKLKTSDEGSISDPTEDQIQETLRRLDEQGGFAILERAEGEFIQCSVAPDSGFVLEYREGGDRIYHAEQEAIPRDRIETVFTTYLNGASDWKQAYNWEEKELSGAGCLSVFLLILTFGLFPPQ